MPIRILLADDHEVIREGLVYILNAEKDYEVVGQASTGRQAVELAGQLHPDIVVMDVSMPDLNGIDATRLIRKQYPDISIVVLSMHFKRQFILDMIREGARGYILKSDVSKQLIQGIQSVVAGGFYLSSQISGTNVENTIFSMMEPEDSHKRSTSLSSREREVLQLLAEGHTNKSIGLRLNIGIKTVETLRRRIVRKLGVSSIAELTKIAVTEGLTDLE